ncbi:restriction endonuclease subunit S [Capnocytophaga cynodegmi]|uniref:restriction endonuclease subunit S n=1 Tax=Capnocytophaga cynodegmi TaxID=28189 RepID=UPI00385E21F4
MSEVLLSKVFENKDFRFDTDFWTKEPKINPSLKYMKIGDCLKISQYGISISMNEEERGIPIYRMNEIHNMLCDFSVSKYADTTEKELEIFRLNDRDVLFNRTNSFEWVGRTGIFYEQSKQDFIFASYLVRFVPNEEIILPEYLTTYLNTRYGIWDLKRRARQSINQTNINPEEVKESLIPILDKSFQLQIKSFFEISRDSLKLSQQKYTEAENLLLETLNLKDFQPNNESVNIKTLKESFLQTGRLDAEFYQKKYEEIEQKIQNYIEGFAPLGKVCTLKDTNFTPNDNTEYAYIELSNIGNSGEIAGCTREMGINLPTRARRKVSENDVIVSSIEGSLKSCAIISKEYHNALCSTGFYVVASEQINAETLLVLFKSELMQQILKKNCSGTILTAINKEEFLNIPIPIIGKKYQEQIAEYIQKANQLRAEAQILLQEAKLSVESAIESQLAENQNISGGG